MDGVQVWEGGGRKWGSGGVSTGRMAQEEEGGVGLGGEREGGGRMGEGRGDLEGWGWRVEGACGWGCGGGWGVEGSSWWGARVV